jgi:hypothetical protein
MALHVRNLFVCAFLCLGISAKSALAQDAGLSCGEEELNSIETCISDSVLTCIGVSDCSPRLVRIDDIVDKIEARCVYKPDGETRKTEAVCRRCIQAIKRDVNTGASKILFPQFMKQVKTALDSARDLCVDPDEGSEDEGDDSTTPGQRFCEKYPNARVCQDTGGGGEEEPAE